MSSLRALPLLLLAVGTVSSAQVSIDSVGSGSSPNGVSSSIYWSQTIGSSPNRLQLVGVALRDAGGNSVISVTSGGVFLTRVPGGVVLDGTSRIELWYLLDPSPGYQNVTVNLSSSTRYVGGSICFAGVDPLHPLGTFSSATGSSTTPTLDFAGTPGSLAIDLVAANGTATFTAGSAQTQQWTRVTNASAQSANVRAAMSTQPGAASLSSGWTLSASEPWVIGAISVLPADGGAANPDGGAELDAGTDAGSGEGDAGSADGGDDAGTHAPDGGVESADGGSPHPEAGSFDGGGETFDRAPLNATVGCACRSSPGGAFGLLVLLALAPIALGRRLRLRL